MEKGHPNYIFSHKNVFQPPKKNIWQIWKMQPKAIQDHTDVFCLTPSLSLSLSLSLTHTHTHTHTTLTGKFVTTNLWTSLWFFPSCSTKNAGFVFNAWFWHIFGKKLGNFFFSEKCLSCAWRGLTYLLGSSSVGWFLKVYFILTFNSTKNEL